MSEIMGKRLKYLREKSGLQQKFVADKIGVKNNTLSGYESGNREPDSETLTRLADFYGVTTDYLLGRNEKKEAELDPEIRTLARDYKKLQPSDQELLKGLIKSMSERGKKALDEWSFHAQLDMTE